MSKICTFCIILVIFGSLFGQEGADYLIITHDDFAQTINSLAEWKYMKGLQTRVVELSEIGEDPSNEDIRNYIISAYNTWDPQPDYVLLVGDLSFLPIGQTSPYKSDNYYADINGDTLADLNLGRFPCVSQAQCSVMVAKTLAYERWPYLNDTAWFQKATTIQADTFPTHHPDTTIYYQRDGVAFVCSLLINAGFVQIDTFLPDDNADSVIQALNQGRSYLLYTGHGYGDRWQFPFVIDPETGSLQNGTKLPVIVSWSCKTVFYTTNLLGERWLKVGTTNNPKGAVAYLGTTADGTAPYRSPVARNFFRSVLEDRPLRLFINLGKAFNEGRDSLWHIAYPYTTTTERHRRYAECNLLGDPTLQLWTEVPQSMIVEHPAAIEMDVPIDLVITVHDTESQLPIQGALVTLYKPDGITPEVFQSEVTDIEGKAIFENLTVPSSGTMYVTATLGNYVPYQGEIQVYQIITDDPYALAYNGNKHLVREPNTDNLHLVYTNAGNVTYRYSGDGGENWTKAEDIEEGEFPAICLDHQRNPCVTWTNGNRLFFGKKDLVQGWTTTSYYFGVLQPSHPCITVTTNEEVDIDTVHILVRLLNSGFSTNLIREVSFPITNPERYQTRTLDASSGMNMITLDFPSIARDYNSMLHATWMHEDTVYYGIRAQAQERWNVWEDPFDPEGHNSDHPLVETYGDSIFVVWQNESDEEIYRGYRHLQEPNFDWANLSQTPTISLYPVNASGMVTTFVDKSSALSEYDIFWRTSPDAPLHNLSNTPLIKSIFPHTSLQITEEQEPPIQYSVWLEGNEAPYGIKREKTTITRGRNSELVSAYFNSISGFETPSLYLIERDTFIPDWQIPVDVGYDNLKYEFPLEPPYTYKVKIIAYHEFQGRLTTRVKLDGGMNILIRYNAFQPETLEILIPPALYRDSMIEAEFDNVSGGLAIGPIYIYRYEQEGGGRFSGGPMAQQSHSLISGSIGFSPNPFIQTLSIRFQSQAEAKFSIKAYDVTGRFVKNIYEGMIKGSRIVCWYGDDNKGRTASQGIYFLRIENLETKESIIRKVLKIE